MRSLRWMVLLLAIAEMASIAMMADWIGGGATLLLMLLSLAGGVLMLRHIGLSGVVLAGAALRDGQKVSLYQLLWPIRYTVAALLLMSPGFVSDIAAVLLLLPIRGKPLTAEGATSFDRTASQGDIIEGEYTVKNGKPSPHAPDQRVNKLPHDV